MRDGQAYITGKGTYNRAGAYRGKKTDKGVENQNNKERGDTASLADTRTTKYPALKHPLAAWVMVSP